MKTCMICESRENVIDLFGYFEHEAFSICKTCARLASTLHNGDLLNFRRQVVKAEQRQPKKPAALAAPEPDDTHFEGYDQARRTLETVTDKSELLTTLDAFQGRGELSEDSPLDQLRQAALDQQERDWRIDPRRI